MSVTCHLHVSYMSVTCQWHVSYMSLMSLTCHSPVSYMSLLCHVNVTYMSLICHVHVTYTHFAYMLICSHASFIQAVLFLLLCCMYALNSFAAIWSSRCRLLTGQITAALLQSFDRRFSDLCRYLRSIITYTSLAAVMHHSNNVRV